MRWLVAVAIVLAGCSGSPPVIEEVDETVRGAIIDVFVEDAVQRPSNGTIAVMEGVNVTFDGSQSVGAESTYLWDFGDNQTASGPTVQHAFSPGLFTVRLTVGTNGTARDSMRLDVAQIPEPAGVFLAAQRFDFSGDLILGNPNSATTPGTDYQDHVVAIGDQVNGSTAVANAVNITLVSSGGAIDTYLYWRSPAGENLAMDQGSGTDKDLQYAGSMPAGDYIVRVRAFLGADVAYTITGEVNYVTP